MLVTRALCVLGSVSLALITITPTFAFAQVATTTNNITATTTTNTVPIDPHNQADVARAVAQFFSGIPVMSAIAKCESDDRQFADLGGVLNGGSGGMIGVFQINKSVHAKFALTLGDDIATLDGNMAYAKYLYENEGTVPWNSSKPCWGSAAQAVAAAATSVATAVADEVVHTSVVLAATQGTLSATLKLGSNSSQVQTLQKILNSAGYYIAKNGAGSPGQETSRFGSLTKLAVERFQCAQNIVCKGSERTTGYGLVGAKTRAALLQAGGLAINKK